jgi:hypothetical protein
MFEKGSLAARYVKQNKGSLKQFVLIVSLVLIRDVPKDKLKDAKRVVLTWSYGWRAVSCV